MTDRQPPFALVFGILFALLLFVAGCSEDVEGVGEIIITGSLADGDTSISPRDRPPRNLRGILQLVLDASRDEELSGVLVRIGALDGGPARISEVRDALLRLRESGRTVHCHMENGTNLSYMLH